MPATQIRAVFSKSMISRWTEQSYDRERPVLFMHIPKTSGMALSQGLAEALQSSNTVAGFDRSLFGHFEAYDDIAPAQRRTVFLSPPGMPNDADFVCAHVAFSTLKARYPDPQCVTFLREPISRLLSHWIYWRTQSDEVLRPWGKWGERVRLARKPLIDFLSLKDIACQTDNIAIRMLLWPHRLIPDNGFIDPKNDQILLAGAIDRLHQFAYIDVIENPDFAADLGAWLGQPFTYATVNETKLVPAKLRLDLHRELTAEAFDLLDQRSRLDQKLWKMSVERRLDDQDMERLRTGTLMRTVARHVWLMTAPENPPRSLLRRTAAAGRRTLLRLVA